MDTQRGKNPLGGKEVIYLKSWAEWKDRWEKESCAEMLHSLLHFGFDVSADQNEVIERLCLYLEIADHADRYRYSMEDPRKALSQKAFQMLCQNFFKNMLKDYCILPSLTNMVIIPQMLDKLFWFFRVDNFERIRNFYYFLEIDEHQKQIARNFVHELCLFVWDCGDGAYPGNKNITEEVRDTFRQARSEVITLLSGLGELDLLLKGNRYNEIDEDCLKRLESLAFAHESSFLGVWRKPRTIEEACFYKSQAAQVLILLRILLAEEGRFDEIRRLEEERKEAERKLAELNKKM